MMLRDKYGWPVERIKGRPFTNLIRLILWTDIIMTWKLRNAIRNEERYREKLDSVTKPAQSEAGE